MEEAHSTATWFHSISSTPVKKGPNNGITMGFHKRSNSQILIFTNYDSLLTRHKHWLGYINYNNNNNNNNNRIINIKIIILIIKYVSVKTHLYLDSDVF
jgi:hypothetical protein